VPIIGVLLYLFFGKNWRIKSKREFRKRILILNKLNNLLRNVSEEDEEETKILKRHSSHPQNYELINLLSKNSRAVLTTSNRIKIYQSGFEKFKDLMKDLRNAKSSIHFEYFIWRSDILTKEIHDILIKKAKEGVEVRIMYDALGGFLFKRTDKKRLKKAGVKLHSFSNKFLTLNYRNHRKIAIIDGNISYLGGMNMGQEYIDGGGYKFWKDTHMKIIGRASQVLQTIFINDWYHATKEKMFSRKYFPTNQKTFHKLPMQIAISGPDSKWESINQLYFSLINSVDKYIYIRSPYFVPDRSIIMALKTAALRGLDVRLMVTGVADKKIPYWAAFTFFRDLMRAGVKIYHYNRGLMHSKTIVLDDQISTVGTANMDSRSFFLNYELNALMYDKKTAIKLRDDFLEDLKYSKRLYLSDYNSFNIFVRIRNSLARLFSPIL
tara:strand:- start:781 stop:2091 length:1311 start_codon:yes stop_codon:yes gene_type:complete